MTDYYKLAKDIAWKQSKLVFLKDGFKVDSGDPPPVIGNPQCVHNLRQADARCEPQPNGPCVGCPHFQLRQEQ